MIKAIWRKITGAFVMIKSFLRAAIPAAAEEVFAEIKDFAISVVADLEYQDISNDEKRRKALEAIRLEAELRGRKLTSNLALMLLTMALEVYRNSLND